MSVKSNISNISLMSKKDLDNWVRNVDDDTLTKIIVYVDDIYTYTGETTGLSDQQYDKLKDEAIKRGILTSKVGAPPSAISDKKKVKLPYWLGSMNKLTPENVNAIDRWMKEYKSQNYIIEDKLDGVSCLAEFKKGKITLFTRGDGTEGFDISHLATKIPSIPKNLKTDIMVRGELIMPEDVFIKNYQDVSANARNMTAGLVNAKTIKPAVKDLKFVVYEQVGDGKMLKPSAQLQYLSSLGFTVVRHELIEDLSLEYLSAKYTNWSYFKGRRPEDAVETGGEFVIDGLIVQADTPYVRNQSGNPKYAFAFKMTFDSDIVETIVTHVEWTGSKTKRLVPKVHFNPIKVQGATLKKADAYNARYIVNENIGPGARILVTRSKSVKPYIVDVIEGVDVPSMPSISYIWNESGVDIYMNEYTTSMCAKLIEGFFKKLGVEQGGEKTITKLLENGLDNLMKIINATEDDIVRIIGANGKKLYVSLHRELLKADLATLLGASGVMQSVGVTSVEKIIDNYPNILDNYTTVRTRDMISNLLNIGLTKPQVVSVIVGLPWAKRFILMLGDNIDLEKEQEEPIGDSLTDEYIAFSGVRDKDLTEMIKALGGTAQGDKFNKQTTILIAKDPDDSSNKIQKAQKANISIMSVQSFKEKYNIEL